MANISSFLEEALLNHALRNTAYTSPTTVFCGLADNVAVDAEMEAGTLTNEITAYDGDRKAITFGAPSQVGGKATVSNTAALTFVNMPAVTVKYAFIADAATLGNILWWGALTAQKTTNAGDTFEIAIGDLVVDLD